MIEEMKDPKYYEYQNYVIAKREIQESYDKMKNEEKIFQDLQQNFRQKYGSFCEVNTKFIKPSKTYYQGTKKTNLKGRHIIAIIFLAALIFLAIYVQIGSMVHISYQQKLLNVINLEIEEKVK